ncbi:MAG: uroporphyrinogen decarboxylase family protein [Eubacteriales bacterium]
MNVSHLEIRECFKEISEKNKLASDTVSGIKGDGYTAGFLNIMEHRWLEKLADMPDYKSRPEEVYLQAQKNCGVGIIDQWIPTNPLSMGELGYEGASHGATTGSENIFVDGMEIDGPDAVAEHMERFVFPSLRAAAESFNEEGYIRYVGESEYNIQKIIGDTILKTGYATIGFPCLRYGTYGYINYFSAYAMYPELMELDFKLQSEYCRRINTAVAKAYVLYNLPKLNRLDHDMTDSRGTLVNIKSMEKIWFPYLNYCLEPLVKTDLKMIWHCDGNISPMVPFLLETGIRGFQGFQYEDGVDYIKICRMKAKDGNNLFIEGGVSVTRTLPFGTPDDVRNELKFLVENKGDSDLILGLSSSMAPGVKWENVKTFVEGLRYYRNHKV